MMNFIGRHAAGEGGEFFLPEENRALQHVLEVGVLCNNAEITLSQGGSIEKSVGDPLEVALLAIAAKSGLTRENLAQQYPEDK
ncbi:MAG: hypothetical protein ABFS02_14215, partial [Pseudomonadota bacterium]